MTKPLSRWFRFSLRTFFVVLTLFGVWFGLQVKWIQKRRDTLRWIKAHGGQEISYESIVYLVGDPLPPPKPVPWSLRMLGEPSVYNISIINGTDETVQRVKSLFPEAENIFNYPLPKPLDD